MARTKTDRNRLTTTLMLIQEYADAASREYERYLRLWTAAKTKTEGNHYLNMMQMQQREVYAYRESIRIIKEHMGVEN
jgi:hypothetical protein